MIRKHFHKKSKLLIYIVSTFAITLWGISYIWTDRLINLNIPVFYFVFVRILLAGIVLFLLNATSGSIAKIKRKDLPKFLLLAFFEPFIYFICESYGVKETGSPTLSAMIIATIPIFSVGAGMLFFREKINSVNILGILMSLVGIVLVVMSKGELGSNFIFGIILLLVAVLSEVGHATVTKSLSGHYSSQVIVMYQFLIGSVYLLPLFIFGGLSDFSAAYMSADVWFPIICLAVLCSSLAFSLWVSTIKNLGVAKSSIFSALIPVAAAIVAWFLGHEDLNMRQFAGIIISALGVILSQYTKKTPKHHHHHHGHHSNGHGHRHNGQHPYTHGHDGHSHPYHEHHGHNHHHRNHYPSVHHGNHENNHRHEQPADRQHGNNAGI